MAEAACKGHMILCLNIVLIHIILLACVDLATSATCIAKPAGRRAIGPRLSVWRAYGQDVRKEEDA